MRNKKKLIIIVLAIVFFIITLISIGLYIKYSSKNHTYSIYFSNATLPTLYESMDIVKNNQNSAYIWLSRPDTLDLEELKKYNPNITISKYLGDKSETSIVNSVIPEIEDFVNEILKKDKKAKFSLYVDDFYYWIEFPIFIENNIPDELYNIILYTDGTMSYHYKFEIMEKDHEYFEQEKNNYYEIIKNVKSGKEEKISSWNLRNSYLKPSNDNNIMTSRYINYNYLWISILRNNVEYNLQYPELINFKDKEIELEMQNSNINKESPKDKFEKLEIKEKEELYKILKFDKNYFDSIFYKDNKNKILIITGTNPFYGDYSKNEFESIINQVCQNYNNEYKLFYKPHPKAEPSEEQKNFLEESNIEILPASLPMEIIGFVYSDIKLGGFASSLYMSFDKLDTMFFFEKESKNLVEPLDTLFENSTNIEFIQPKDN